MKKDSIPQTEFKFLMSTDKKICPKCKSTNVKDTGHRADNFTPTIINEKQIPRHPVYRCKDCGQLFRLRQAV